MKKSAAKSAVKSSTRKKSPKKTSILSRIKGLPKPAIIALWAVIFGAIGVKMLLFSGATAFQFVGVHPQAAKQPDTTSGRSLKSLETWNGKVYAGYGDYNANTGPISLTPFDPVTNTFASTPEHVANTESIEIFKKIGNKFYAVHIDPKSGDPAYSVAELSADGKPVWTNHQQPPFTHVYGLTSYTSENDLFLSGSHDVGSGDNEVAKVYRSTDGGATWVESLTIPSRGGFNRMTLVAKLGDKVYAQNLSTADFNGAQSETKAWVFNGSGWSKATPIGYSSSPYKGTEFGGKLLVQAGLYGGYLVAYDGRKTTALRSNIRDYKVHSDGYVYTLGYFGSEMTVMRSKDLSTWETVTKAPTGASSIALLGDTIFIGTSDSELYKAKIDPSIQDTAPPTATLIAPASSYTVTTTNEFAVDAFDSAGIGKVEFYAGSTLLGYTSYKASNITNCLSLGDTSESCFWHSTRYPGKYSFKWNGSGIAAGTYPLKAIVYDTYGNSKETTSVSITVPQGLYPPDTEGPLLTLTSPNSDTVKRSRGNISIYTSATDSGKVVYMEAQLDGVTIASGSYAATYATLSKRVAVDRGSHTLVISAIDQAGNTSRQEKTFTAR